MKFYSKGFCDPDGIMIPEAGINIYYKDKDAVAFGYYNVIGFYDYYGEGLYEDWLTPQSNIGGVTGPHLFCGIPLNDQENCITHKEIIPSLANNGIKVNRKEMPEMAGRIWTNSKSMSFWKKPDAEKISKLAYDLKLAFKLYGIDENFMDYTMYFFDGGEIASYEVKEFIEIKCPKLDFEKDYEDGGSPYDDKMYRNVMPNWKYYGKNNESVQKISIYDLKKMVFECAERIIKNRMINENREAKMRSKARHMAVERGFSPERAAELDKNILHDIPNARIADFKFFPGVMRLLLDGELNNGPDILNFNNYLEIIGSNEHVNEYDSNFNGMSYHDIDNRFKVIRQQLTKDEKEKSLNRSFNSKSDYRIVRIPDFETAEQFGKYTSWCVTHGKGNYDSYTGDGTGLFYFCLKNGFENVEKVPGANAPLDEYGLSMIAVSVNMDGSPNTITSRWNHDNGGNDSIMTVEELEDIIQMSFYGTFKPYTRDELHAKGVILFDEVQDLLDSGKNPQYIFKEMNRKLENGFLFVRLNNKYNFVDNNMKLVSPNLWFDGAAPFHEGMAEVELNDKFNYINTEGKLLSPNQWFDFVETFSRGFGLVELNRKYNLIGKDGKFLGPNQGFEYASRFYDGLSIIKLNNKWNYLKTDGKLLSPNKWFDEVYEFDSGFGFVELDDKWNFIKADGNLLSPNQWFDDVYHFHDGFAAVRIRLEFNYINTEGNLLSPNQWFDNAYAFNGNTGCVKKNGAWYYIDRNGKLY